MSVNDLYQGREQTLVKHFILRKYLERFARIVGSHWDTLTYVDCFAGPWNAHSDEFEDTSFGIALGELRKARDTLTRARGRSVGLRCFFLEKDPPAHSQLREFANQAADATIETRNATLEDSIDEIVNFVRAGGRKTFPFIFIDPTGWTGFAMETITPLLQIRPGEVLVNFMTGHIRRFLESPDTETQESFRRLFGSAAFRERVRGLVGLDREDAAVDEYTTNAQTRGRFTFSSNAIVLHPDLDRTHFNLIYLTRNAKGIEVFKDAEKTAMRVQEDARAGAQQRRRLAQRPQTEMFPPEVLHDSTHYNSLRDRYTSKSRGLVVRALESERKLLYDDIWALALSQPMTWESDLKQWIHGWQVSGNLRIEGMEPRQRVPRREASNFLVWQ